MSSGVVFLVGVFVGISTLGFAAVDEIRIGTVSIKAVKQCEENIPRNAHCKITAIEDKEEVTK
tara:strand:+ start:257 stop:445 length:189 start_codon:yes stop_codon:yes gene_type:complete